VLIISNGGAFMYALNLEFDQLIQEKESKYQGRVQLDEIMKKLFYISNKRLVIDLLNSLYGDNIGYDADLTYLNKETISESARSKNVLIRHECDMLIGVNYEGVSYEYLLEFQTRNDRRIAIRLFRYSFELKVQNVRDLYGPIVINLPNPYVIVLERNKNVPESYELILKSPEGGSLRYIAKVLKYWDFGLGALYERNMHLLFPLKVFEVRRKITKVKKINKDNQKYPVLIKEIKDDILKVTREILEYVEIIYKEKKIEDTEFNEFGVIIANLTAYLSQEVDKLSDVNEEVEKMVKTFYDPKVAEKSAQMATLRTKREAIFELLEDVGNISDEVKALIEKEEDFDILKRWLKIAAKVGSMDEFMDKVRVH
jgi:hypothetical protein